MTQKEKVKDYDLLLQKYIDNKSYIKISRTVFNEEENLSGFLLAISKDFLFLQVDNDFTLDGYAIIKKDDFDSIQHSNYERAKRKIFNAEKVLSTSYGFDKDLPLTNWTSILKKLKSYGFHIIVQNINKDYLDFWIGEIKNVTSKSLSIHNYDPAGVLDDKPTNIKFSTISVIKFGDRYSTIFRKYLKKK